MMVNGASTSPHADPHYHDASVTGLADGDIMEVDTAPRADKAAPSDPRDPRRRSSSSSRRRSRSRGADDRDRRHRSSRHRDDSRDRDRGYDRDRERERRRRSSRSRSRDRYRSSRDRSRDRGGDRYRYSSSRDRYRSPDRRDRDRGNGRRRAPSPFVRPAPVPDLTQPERDDRTVFVAQLHANVRAADIVDFFEEKHKVGRIRGIRLIADRGSRRAKGVGYIEFYDLDAIDRAVETNGQLLMGIPIIVERTEAEKNRIAAAAAAARAQAAQQFGLDRPGAMPGTTSIPRGVPGTLPPRPPLGAPKKDGPSHTLYVTNLPPQLSDSHIRQIYEPFGRVDDVRVQKDALMNSTGAAFVTFQRESDAETALTAMADFAIAGNKVKCTMVTDSAGGAASTELDDADGQGIRLNALSKVELMAKLSRTAVVTPPPSASAAAPAAVPSAPNAAPAMVMTQVHTPTTTAASAAAPLVSSRCLMLTNMFDPAEETEPDWDRDIEVEVQQEVETNYGPVRHIRVLKDTAGHVAIKFAAVDAAERAARGLNGRWFAQRQLTGTLITEDEYNSKFPEATSL
ncbi:Phosphatidylinositol-3-phosphatase SAC1 [Blastocladiella emersonii ATCC 22665]|nr:Phosphatidylinositol-3-phosphatase SAC1 [Blastocladiella emersonii ATCC 22665]